MLERGEILSNAKAVLEAADDLNGITVLLWDGTQEKQVEEQMRSVGAVVLISPVMTFTPGDQAAGAAVGPASFKVRLAINPKVSSDLATPWDFDALRDGIASSLQASPADDHGERFRLVSDVWNVDFDPGELVADMEFERAVQLNPVR